MKQGAGSLVLHNSYGEPEDMPVEVFFREEEDLSTLEHLALIECKGKILDLGAGTGVHSLILQARGKDVTALENSPGCAYVMRHSGVKRVVFEDYRNHTNRYDTLLLLMNGLGLAGTNAGLIPMLNQCKNLLNPGGQILVDSSDISYLYEDGLEKPEGYYGEIRYQYEYKQKKGEWFDWLYADQDTLIAEAAKAKMSVEILHTDENDQYLACLTCE
ncbi:MAG: methyltransferase [Cyclobacteriaceae bacterium]